MSWRRFLKRRWWDSERASEIEAYLDVETADNVARGMPPGEAAAAARRKFGNPGLVREDIYRMNTIGWLESIWQDLRYGARLLRLSPGFAIVAIASLALGIGANTAIFQLLDAVRLRNLPVRNPQELAEVKIVGGNHGMGLNQQYGELTRAIWQQIREHQQSFSGMFAWSANQRYVGQGSQMKRFKGLWVSGDFFGVLGVRPWRGRLLLPEDLALVTRTRYARAYFEMTASKATGIAHTSSTKITGFRVPMRPIADQRRVVHRVHEALARIDELRAPTERQVSLLAERRQALITAAVTGGISV